MKSSKNIQQTGRPPTRPTIASRIARGWTEQQARETPTLRMGVEIKEELRPYCYPKGDKWLGNIRGPGDLRLYLGTYPTEQEARDAAARYIVTGQKPPRKCKAQGSPKRPYKARSTTGAAPPRKTTQALQSPIPLNSAAPDRIDVMRQILLKIG